MQEISERQKLSKMVTLFERRKLSEMETLLKWKTLSKMETLLEGQKLSKMEACLRRTWCLMQRSSPRDRSQPVLKERESETYD
jgi:hypothetical protein